jgi:hypothetical protein
MLKNPYGESDFHKVLTRGYYYQDRTNFIEQLERWSSNYPVFLRPRRFGKSLFVSLLQHYYGLEYEADFQTLFGGLYIGQNTTSLANSYLVLRFEFSRIDTASHESTYRGFLENVLYGADLFLSAYPQFFSATDRNSILAEKAPESVIKAIFRLIRANNVPNKIYLLIDEYDHFANELLSFDLKRFKEDVSRNGFVRKFYESLKTAAGDGIVDRIFITGVSPITLDSLTSGYNISSNITTNPIFHDMMGFSAEEVEHMLHLSGISATNIQPLLQDLKEWYNGYRFCSDVSKKALFNPDMVLYFLQQYGIQGQYPEIMLDTNVVSDYRKVRNYFRMGGEENERFELLENLIQTGHRDFNLTLLFDMDERFTEEDFLSLLFYLGILTVQEPLSSDWRFRIPNYVIKKLYFEYFTSIYLSKTRFAKTHYPITKSIDAIVNEANPAAFFQVVEHVLAENHSNRDELVYGEKHLQTLMIGLLFPYKAFLIHSEYESRKAYPDIFLERIPGRMMNYEVVLELKYVKKSHTNTLPQVIQEAEQQLSTYMQSERFARPDVRGFYVIFVGGQVHQWREWGKY